MSVLWVISTPIGNLDDVSFRLKEILENCDILLVESLSKYKKISYFLKLSRKHKVVKWSLNKKGISKKGIEKFFIQGKTIGLMSDAGAPNIADPGYEVVSTAIQCKAKVFSLPGPSSVGSALSLSRWPTLPCFIWGFPPKSDKKIFNWLEKMSNLKGTHLIFANPAKLRDLILIVNKFINADLQLFSEISKIHEKRFDGKPQKILRLLPETVKGEWLILLKFV